MSSPILSLISAGKIYISKLLSINFFEILPGVVLALILQHQLLILGIILLMILDTITGIWSAKKQKIKIDSNKFWYFGEKAIIYTILLATGIIVDFSLGLNICTYIFGSTILGRELLSNLENLDVISGGSWIGGLYNKVKDYFTTGK